MEESGDSFDTSEGIDGLRKATLAAMESELQQLRNELAECRVRIGAVCACCAICRCV